MDIYDTQNYEGAATHFGRYTQSAYAQELAKLAAAMRDADIDRFAALGVIPNMQPLWAQLDPLMVELTIPRLGEDRSDKQYRLHSLDESGAPLALGARICQKKL